MSDILVVNVRSPGRTKVHFIANSLVGAKWIINNMEFEGEGSNVYFRVDVEHQEDIIQKLKEADVTYEERYRI